MSDQTAIKGHTHRDDHIDDRQVSASSSALPPWQFSLRSLLIATAVISVILAIGVHLTGFMFALLVIAIVQVSTLLSADWLIRPQNRRALAFVTAGSWIVLGSGLVIVGVREVLVRAGTDSDLAIWIFAWCLIGIGMICYYIAGKRWRRLTGNPAPGAKAPTEPDFHSES
jgi:hypothetical protein